MGATAMNKEAMALLEAIKSAEAKVDVVPPGWMTMAQMANEIGMSRDWVEKRMAKVKHECRNFRIRIGLNGVVRHVPHYRISQ